MAALARGKAAREKGSITGELGVLGDGPVSQPVPRKALAP